MTKMSVELSECGGSDHVRANDPDDGPDDPDVDAEVVRPVVRSILSHMMESGDGQVSLSQLSSRLVDENVLTPGQVRRRQSWIAQEAESFLEEVGGDTSSSEPLEHGGEWRHHGQVGGEDGEEEDLFASMSQLFNLDSSDSSATKMRKAVPLSLSQNMESVSDGGGAEEQPASAPRKATPARAKRNERSELVVLANLNPEEKAMEVRKRQRVGKKRFRTFVKWQMDKLAPLWPDNVTLPHCRQCASRYLCDTCLVGMCDECCRERPEGGCGGHGVLIERNCVKCHARPRLKGCAFEYCHYCCVRRVGGGCPTHENIARGEDVRSMTLGSHETPASEVQQGRRRVCDLYCGWDRGDDGAVAEAVLWLRRRRGNERYASLHVSQWEMSAFVLGLAGRQQGGGPVFLSNLRSRCYDYLHLSRDVVSAKRRHEKPATALLVENVVSAICNGSSDVAAVKESADSPLFHGPTTDWLVALALEQAALRLGGDDEEKQLGSSLKYYRQALEREDATPADMASAGAGLLRVLTKMGNAEAAQTELRELCVKSGFKNLPLLFLYAQSGAEFRADDVQIHEAILQRCPTFSVSLLWLCDSLGFRDSTIDAVMRALLVDRERVALWEMLDTLIAPRAKLTLSPLWAFFVEELFTYGTQGPEAKQRVGKHLPRLLVA